MVLDNSLSSLNRNNKITPAAAARRPVLSSQTKASSTRDRLRRTTFFRNPSHFIERDIGYGDLDDWNALPVDDQTRIRGHSRKLFKAFQRTRWFLLALGRFPFKTKQLDDGSYTFTLNYFSISYGLFCITTVAMFIIFIMFTVGIVFIGLDIFAEPYYHDRCGNTWGQTIMKRNMPAVVFIWSEITLTALGSVYIITHSTNFLEFYNVVNEAVMQMDIDPTDGLFMREVSGNIVFVVLFIFSIIIFATKGESTLDDVSEFVIQAIFFFNYPDLYKIGSSKVFTAKDYEELYKKCDNSCKDCYTKKADYRKCLADDCYNNINQKNEKFEFIKWCGFLIIAYSVLGARALLRQLEFFCQVLVNLASTWNKRFLNYGSRDNKIQMNDPYRRRISDLYILKDHYQIVRLYNVAELNFSFILFVYYAFVLVNLFFQFYFTALLSSQVTCAQAVQRERDAATKGLCYQEQLTLSTVNKSIFNGNLFNGTLSNEEVVDGFLANVTLKNVTFFNESLVGEYYNMSIENGTEILLNESTIYSVIVNNNKDVLESGLKTGKTQKAVAAFEDPCVKDQKTIIRHASVSSTILLVITLTSFISTTIEADRASHQADVGFYRVRKHGYMACRTKLARNTMHSLVFSFTGPKAFCITAAGYFYIRKKTIVVVIAVAFIYFLIILSFKPGMIAAYKRCYTVNDRGKRQFVIKYPSVI